MEYRTVAKASSDEFVEKKSRFIGYIKPVTTQDEAVTFINEIKSKHWDATHNVYAYVLRDGQTRRYSDDGEPQGTAGPTVLLLQPDISAARFSAPADLSGHIPIPPRLPLTQAEL